MNTKVKAIILGTKDYGEADKLASVFCYELGIITIKFSGVKKANSKYKNVCQPFCLCELDLAQKSNYFTVTQAYIIDNHFGLVTDYDKTVCAYIVSDILLSIVPKAKVESELFALTIKAIDFIEKNSAFIGLKNFILTFIDLQGVGLDLNLSSKYKYIDKEEGNFVNVKNINCTQIDNSVYNFLQGSDEVSRRVMISACKLLNMCLTIKFDYEIKSFSLLK